MAINWTKEQKAVIESRNRNLLGFRCGGQRKDGGFSGADHPHDNRGEEPPGH